MLSGCPVVATDLPGVREPVRVTGMGEVVPIKNARALADGILEILDHREQYVRTRKEIAELFSLENTVREYEKLFESLRRP
jgi:glycosyltransferase involved in cell wall biosynthesis